MSTPEERAQWERYIKAGHALQSAIGFQLSLIQDRRLPAGLGTPKDLRTGVDMNFANCAALAELLMQKGIITRLELYTELADWTEREVRQKQDEMSTVLGSKVDFL